MKPLTTEEIEKAVALIANMPFDLDVIVSVRILLGRHEATQRNWKRTIEGLYSNPADSASADPDDTKEFMPFPEMDGD